MAEVQWFYARGDEQLGPVTPGDLRRLAATGNLAPADLVWREGMGEWAPAARIKGLFPDARESADEAPQAPAVNHQAQPPAPSADTPPGAPAFGEPNVTTSMPEGLFPPEASEPEMFAGESPVGPPQAGPIESGLFRTTSAADVEASFPAAEAPRASRSRVPMVLLLAQGALWGTCGLVVLLGGLLFTVSRLRGTSPAEEAASATVLGMFFIGVYVVAQAGEKISKLVLALRERRNE